ncbi:thermonuclease family protein [Stenoxybacter acetivorans]|uniref:thermonuclease family protein n=1 Tax=Stenoxybacter acetivorans TaxID=422441 RepID=UPI00068A052A|nr:thermonuclease family protein [Stenoxybacter acetivorans]
MLCSALLSAQTKWDTVKTAAQNVVTALRIDYSGKVLSVHDGDTLRVRDDKGYTHKIRLAYIDAPELQQAGGFAARDALRGKVQGKRVDVVYFGKDQYQREIAKIVLNKEDINAWLIENGWAWHYKSIAKREQNDWDYAVYQRIQTQAQAARAGLWQSNQAVPPWQFRHRQP